MEYCFDQLKNILQSARTNILTLSLMSGNLLGSTWKFAILSKIFFSKTGCLWLYPFMLSYKIKNLVQL